MKMKEDSTKDPEKQDVKADSTFDSEADMYHKQHGLEPAFATNHHNAMSSAESLAKHDPRMERTLKKRKSKLMLPDAEDMKRQARKNVGKNAYDVKDFYKTTGFCQHVARNPRFEQSTLLVIVLNAVYMAIDADWNDAADIAKAFVIFQICENLFCLFFSGELIIRLLSFRRKCNCLRDAWFVFDSILVTTMVLETWFVAYVLPFCGVKLSGGGLGNTGILRLLRLLRLSRMSRMARLLRSVPELMILLKGIGQASSSCAWTAMLLVIAMYVWALALKQISADSPLQSKYFPDIPNAMYNLMITGCLMKGCDLVLKDMKDEGNFLCWVLYFLFVVFSGVTVMKMLTGMLCKVINAVAAQETEKMSVGFAQDELLEVMMEMGYCDAPDVHHVNFDDLVVSPDVFGSMLQNDRAVDAFKRIGIDVVGLVTAADFIFPQKEDEENRDPNTENWSHHHEHLSLPWADFMEAMLMLRGSNAATVKDMVDVRKFVRTELVEVEHNLATSIYRIKDHADAALERATHYGDSCMEAMRDSRSANGEKTSTSAPHCADAVFQDFCTLSETERARFFSLLAGSTAPKERCSSRLSEKSHSEDDGKRTL